MGATLKRKSKIKSHSREQQLKLAEGKKPPANSDLERYRHHLDKFDLTDEQKLKLVGALEHIVECLLNKKYGLEPE